MRSPDTPVKNRTLLNVVMILIGVCIINLATVSIYANPKGVVANIGTMFVIFVSTTIIVGFMRHILVDIIYHLDGRCQLTESPES